MIKSLTTASLAALLGLALSVPAMAQTTPTQKGAMKLSQAECQNVWNRLDASKSGSITQAAAQSYVTDFKSVDTNNDAKLSQAEFEAGCNKGMVHSSASTGTGTGTTGTGATGTKN